MPAPRRPKTIEDLWNEAYDKLKDETGTKDLMETYEKILSSEKLQKMMIVGKKDGEESSDAHIGRKALFRPVVLPAAEPSVQTLMNGFRMTSPG